MILIIHLFKKIGIFEINIKQAKINIFHFRIIKLKSHTNIMTRTDIYDIFLKHFLKTIQSCIQNSGALSVPFLIKAKKIINHYGNT